jgi:hypothetical protein
VLTAERTPRISPETWSITVDGKVEFHDRGDPRRQQRYQGD